uniref:Uncharacterized protein n=1 Tax=Tanacetum cinerariifolium TaxID=118510 RepID=A0A6L2LE12_TANCI|nr:hypothetical protein [Tanacetum cinerariifolium]
MAQTPPRSHTLRGHNKQYARMPFLYPQWHVVPTVVITKSKLVPINTARPITAAILKPLVTRPRPAKPILTKPHTPPKRHINQSPSPKPCNFPPKVTAVTVAQANPQHALKDKVIDSGCSRVVRFLMCDKKNNVLFIDTECLVLSLEFKLPDENQVLLRVPKENNMYNVNLKNIVLSGDLTCLFVKATLDESNLWHRRLGHIIFKTMNKLVKGNLVRGLPTKVFKNNDTCVACKQCKEHRASCKTKPVSFVNQSLQRLYMDLFGPTFVKSLNKKSYYLVITYDYSRFTWVFFLATKDETSSILKTFITGIENQLSLKDSYWAARTMLADLLLPIPFWAEVVNTTCYVQNRVLVTKPQNKTPYELLQGRTPSIGFMRPFGCPVTILNTLDSLGKFDGKVDEEFLVRSYVSSKAFRVFISRTRIVQETLHINFLENKPNVTGSGPTWLFDIDTLTKIMNYQPVTIGNQSNPSACVQEQFDAEKAGEENVQQYVLFPIWSSGRKPESKVNVSLSSSAQTKKHDDKTKGEAKGKSHVESLKGYKNLSAEFKDFFDNNINKDNAAGTLVLAVGQISTNSTNTFSVAGPSNAVVSPTHGKSLYVDPSQLPDDPNMPELEDITYFDDEDGVGIEADFNNLETSIIVSLIPTTRVHKDHLINNDDFHTCMFACFLSQKEPKRVHQALKDPSWIEAMQDELLQFKMQKVWVLIDLPHGKRAIGTKWVFRNKKDERGIVVRNKARLVAQGHTQEEGIDYEEIFAPVVRIEAIRLFLAYASFMGFMVYKMDVKSAFLYGAIEEEVYVCQPLGFEDPDYPDKVYKVVNALYGLHQAPRAWYETLIYVDDTIFGLTNKDLCKAFEKLMKDKFQMSSMGELTFFLGLQKVNDITRLQDLVDKKKVVITEATIRDALRLDDAEGVECLPNEEIFTELARMGYEKPSTKLTFYKGFFSSADEVHVKNVSTAGVAAEGVASVADDEVPAAVDEPSIPSPPPPTQPLPPSQDIPSTSQDVDIEPTELQEVVEVVTTAKLITKVVTKFNSNVAFLQKTKEKMEEEDSRALKRISETQEEKAAKRQKLDEEVEELRKHLMIVPNDDDDVYNEAIPLALKVLVVDYEIYTENYKPYYKIKRADDSHQLYISFLSMIRNFDREDLEVL